MNSVMKQTTAVIMMGAFLGVFFVGALALADDMGDMNGKSNMSSGMGSMSTSTSVGHGKGVIKIIDRKEGKVTIKHGPIKEFGWRGMTMTFPLLHRSSLTSLKKGEHVSFDVIQDNQGHYTITKIHPLH